MASRLAVEVFYDTVSPYSYLGLSVLRNYEALWGMELTLRPFFLGGVMNAVGNQPPAFLAPRGKQLFLDLRRNSEFMGVPISMPPEFPALTIKAQRLLTAARLHGDPAQLLPLSLKLASCYWSEGLDIKAESTLRGACESVGADFDALNAAAQTDEVKEELKAATAEAVERGGYGAPLIFVKADGAAEPEMFFGSDRFEQMAFLFGLPWHGPRGQSCL